MPARQRTFIHENGDPIQFYLHASVEDDKRNELTGLIQKYGGAVLETDEGVDTVIVDPHYPQVYDLQNSYYVHQQERFRRIRVEDTTFIRACIRARTFQHTPVIRYPMRGNHPGRVNYTKEDEENFCRYMAIKIPDIESGGRLGHRVYQDLVSLVYAMPEAYQWVTRHPAESWREHYRNKKNKDRLDAMIEQFRNEEQPTEEQLYMYDRKLNAGRFTNPDEESPTDNEPETYDDYWSRRKARERSRATRSRKAVAQEEEESGSNEEPSGDEDGAPEHQPRPSSLFSVNEYEEEQVDNTQNVPAPSQATLVGNDLGVGQPSNRVSRARKPRDQRVVPTEGAVANEHEESTNIAEPSSPIPPVASTSSQGKRKRGQKAQIPTDNTPYRNTRSMSDSMRPTSLANPRPAKKGRKKKPMEATQSTAEEPQGLPEAPLTITEEADVEQLLMSEPNVEGPHTPSEDVVEEEGHVEDPSKRRRLDKASSSEEEEEEEEEEEDHRASSSSSPREVQLPSSTQHLPAHSLDSEVEQVEETLRGQSLDTDDEQIDRELRRPQSKRTGPRHDEVDPLKLLQEFYDSAASDLPLGVSPSPAASPNTRDRWLPGDEQDVGSDPWRESSVESFPKQGTRASAIKKQVEEKRKMEEYVPPPTSRAARYARRQRK